MILFPLAITQIENDDDRAFMEELFLTYRRLFYKVALDSVNFSDVDDVINSACEKMCRNIYKLRQIPSNGLKAYVVTIVRNAARDHIKANSRQNAKFDYSSDDTLERKLSHGDDVEEYVLLRSLVSDVREAIGRLPNREKEVMLLKYHNNLPTKDIAEMLQITEGNTRGILKRARAHIINDLIEKKRIDADEI